MTQSEYYRLKPTWKRAVEGLLEAGVKLEDITVRLMNDDSGTMVVKLAR